MGVDNGFAGMKFSVSPNIQGKRSPKKTSRIKNIIPPVKSFKEYEG